tara:strand:+ start:574 stop:855 length:282 start_codon:yes stop_codon:yes gene_type:complete
MKLKEILDRSSNLEPMDVRHILARRNQINAIVENPVLVVTDVFNAGGLGFVVGQDEMSEEISRYMDTLDLTEEEKEYQDDILWAQSDFLTPTK